MTKQTLLNYALQEIWCSPTADNQIILESKRICRPEGEIGAMLIMGRTVQLPVNRKRFQVYQVGQIPPSILGLLDIVPNWAVSGWVPFSDAVNKSHLFANIYNINGITIPLFKAHYRFLDTKALVFCIEMDTGIPFDYMGEQPYLRLYTNNFYGSPDYENNGLTTSTRGLTILRSLDIQQIAVEVATLATQKGQVICYKNGQYVSRLTAATMSIGDIVEYIYDPSVKRKLSFKASTLLSFTSIRDQIYKYLIRYPLVADNTIDFVDDVDFFIRQPVTTFKGRYFHRNLPASARNVTQQDFSISVDQFRDISTALNVYETGVEGVVLNNYVDVFIRHGGIDRPLVHEHNRLFEMYKLDDAKVKAAMIGDVAMPAWYAAELENSDYIKLLGTPMRDVTPALVESALGYNAISRILGDMPVYGYNMGGRYAFAMPAALQENSTVYEYDEEGTLLGYYPNTGQDLYIANNETCRQIEAVSGLGVPYRTATHGTTNIDIPTNYSYRVYFCYLNSDGQPNNNWVDVTGDDTRYHISNGKLIWDSPDDNYVIRVQSDEYFLASSQAFNLVAGTLNFHISELVNGDAYLLSLPYGYLDIWLNGKSLIYGLDYFVVGSRVFVVCKEHLKQPAQETPQLITIRFHGLAAKDADNKPIMRSVPDFGFVEHGVLSENTIYNTRDDRVLRITVRGNLKHRSQVKFSELTPGVDSVNPDNGSPYQIRPVIVALKDFAEGETYDLLEASEAMDQVVQDYMTQKLPEPIRPAVSTIPDLYTLYSPFIAHILNDLATGQFNYADIEKELTDQEVLDLVEPYLEFLAWDPLNEDHGINSNYVLIAPHAMPHNVPLDLYSYNFINKVIDLFGRGLVPKSPYITIDLGATRS